MHYIWFQIKDVSLTGQNLKLFLAVLLVEHTECLEEASQKARKSAQAVTLVLAVLLDCGILTFH